MGRYGVLFLGAMMAFAAPVTAETATVDEMQDLTGECADGVPRIWSEYQDYVPGEQVALFGCNFGADEEIELRFEESPQTHETERLFDYTDGEGGFENVDFLVDEHDIGVTFTVTATGLSSGLVATTTFTDGSSLRITSVSPSNNTSVGLNHVFTVSTTTKVMGAGPCQPAFNNVNIALTVPASWSKTADKTVAQIPVNGTATHSWTVHVPSTATPGSTNLGISVSGTPASSCPSGNITSDSASLTVKVVDNISPTVTVPGDITAEATSPSGATVSYNASASDNVGVSSFSCKPASGATFKMGTTEVSCTAKDAAGNTTTESFDVTVQDTTAPSVSSQNLGPFEGNTEGGYQDNVHFQVSASDAADNNVSIDCDHHQAGFYPLGVTTVSCTATDKAGNSSPTSFTVTVVDTTAPVLSVQDLGPFEGNTAGGYQGPVGFQVSAIDVVDPDPAVSCSAADPGFYAVGATTVSCTATDDSSNAASDSFTVTVVDTTAPALSVEDLVLEGNTTGGFVGDAGFLVSATDVVDAAVSIQCDADAGDFYALGDTLVTCTATDDSGNSVSDSFIVTVEDTTAPMLSVEDLVLEGNTTGGFVGDAGFQVSATDVVDADVEIVCDAQAGDFFALGVTEVTCVATDDSGNSDTQSFLVEVVDTTAPTLVGTPEDIAAIATSTAGAVVTYTDPTATDIVDPNPTVSCAPASGSTFTPGSATVTCTATDASGNAATSTFVVTVTFSYSGVLSPLSQTSTTTVKGGSTVPVKFQLTGASAGITDGAFTLSVNRWSNDASGDPVTVVSSGSANTGNLFRYDSTGGLYIFNLSTKGYAAGTYILTIDLGDGVPHQAKVAVR